MRHVPPVPTVTVVDPCPLVRGVVAAIVSRHLGYLTRGYEDGEAFLAAGPPEPGCAVVAVELPGMDGLAVLAELRARGHDLPAVTLTGAGLPAAVARAAGAAAHLRKPFAAPALADADAVAAAIAAAEPVAP